MSDNTTHPEAQTPNDDLPAPQAPADLASADPAMSVPVAPVAVGPPAPTVALPRKSNAAGTKPAAKLTVTRKTRPSPPAPVAQVTLAGDRAMPVPAQRPQLKAGRGQRIPVAAIVEDPENARLVFDPAQQKALSESLDQQGQLYDIVVRTLPAGGAVLVDGARRFRAARDILGWKEIGADVAEMDDKQAALAAAASNLQREGLTPYEQGRAFKRALDAGMNKKQVCAAAGVVFNTLEARLELLALPEDVGRLVKVGRGGFSIEHARTLASLVPHPKAYQAARAYTLATAAKDSDGFPEAGRFGYHLRHAIIEAKAGKELGYDLGEIRYNGADLLRKHLKDVPKIELGGGDVYLDPQAYNNGLNAARSEFAKRNKAHASKGGAGKKDKPIDVKQRERNRLLRIQLELLEQHVPQTKAYGKDWHHVWLHRYLDRLGLIAATKVEREAFGRITGLTKWDGRGPSLATQCEKLGWESVEAGRIMHAALYFETNQRGAWSDEFGVAKRYAKRLLGAEKEALKARAKKEVADELKPKAAPKPLSSTGPDANPTQLVRAKLASDAKAGNLRDAAHYIRWLVDQPGMAKIGLRQAKPIVYRELRDAKANAKATKTISQATAGLEAAKAKLAEQAKSKVKA